MHSLFYFLYLGLRIHRAKIALLRDTVHEVALGNKLIYFFYFKIWLIGKKYVSYIILLFDSHGLEAH